MLAKRVLTVIVGAPILFGVLGVAPKVVFSVLIFVTAILGNYEYFGMTFAKHSQRLQWGGIIVASLISALLVWVSDSVIILPAMMVVWLLTFVVFLLPIRLGRGLDLSCHVHSIHCHGSSIFRWDTVGFVFVIDHLVRRYRRLFSGAFMGEA